MADPSRQAPEEVDVYLAAQPDSFRTALEWLRDLVRETAPGCTERVSYGIPIFRLRKDLIGISAGKNHCSLHSMSPPLIKRMSDELTSVKVSGATVHFTPENPLSRELIDKIIRERMRELDGDS